MIEEKFLYLGHNLQKGTLKIKKIVKKIFYLLIKKDIKLEKYENAPTHMNGVCLKACANVNELYRYLLKNHKTYKCNKKKKQVINHIKNISNEFMTEEELANRRTRNKEKQKEDVEISKYFKNIKYGRAKIEEELNRLRTHINTEYDLSLIHI